MPAELPAITKLLELLEQVFWFENHVLFADLKIQSHIMNPMTALSM